MKTLPKFNNVDIFTNSSIIYMRKPSNKINYWINILLIGSILFGLIACFYEYTIFNIYYSKVVESDENSYVHITVDESFISSKNRNYLTLNNIDCKCHLNSLSDNYYLINNEKFWEAIYECEIPEELDIDNNILEVKINKRKTTLFKELINLFRKELKNARIKN